MTKLFVLTQQPIITHLLIKNRETVLFSLFEQALSPPPPTAFQLLEFLQR